MGHVPSQGDDLKSDHTELIEFQDNHLLISLCGEADAHLKLIERQLGVVIHPRGNVLAVCGEQAGAEQARELMNGLYALLKQGRNVDQNAVEDGLRSMLEQGSLAPVFSRSSVLETPRQTIRPRNSAQALFMETLHHSDLTFGIGPAGTGKTFLAVTIGVALFLQGAFQRIILTRPAVEAGEHLGFLPGDLQAKIDPYLRPLYDALYDTLGMEKVERMQQRGILEIAPLAYMRGRTLNESYVILDEAQNTTPEQMKMFLTRLGEGSRVAVCGDITQVDLPDGRPSGLVHAKKVLHSVKGVNFVEFTARDVVRHPLVQRIVRAYDP
ncbi:MAG: PhoH family protein [Magnetococcales bacterium]|nr:PhoH family protein [Magnetococcales bacterium]